MNRGADVAVILEVGTRSENDKISYPDIDLVMESEGKRKRFKNRAGEPY